jgi:hypothetical protein
MRGALIGFALLLGATACSPVYAPLVRGAHYGAPGRLAEGQMEVGGAMGGVITPTIGGPALALALRDWVSLEAGANLSFVSEQWAMGYLGSRFSWVPGGRSRPYRFAADLEVGVGAGAGGAACSRSADDGCYPVDNREWKDRFAFGSYQGFGLGGHFRWYSLYLRARVEESGATNVPMTVWPSLALGQGFNIKGRVSIDLSGGFMAYSNAQDHEVGWFYQLAVVIFLDAFERESDRIHLDEPRQQK